MYVPTFNANRPNLTYDIKLLQIHCEIRMENTIVRKGGRETLLSYSGNVSDASISCLLELAEHKLSQQNDKPTTRKKVFRVLVETLQNLYHHVDARLPDETKSSICLTLKKSKREYQVQTTNAVRSSEVTALKKGIDEFNAMTLSELKQYYRQKLSNGHFTTDEAGAGLGFADIIRKSGEKISYSFKPVNQDYSYFSLRIKVLA